MRNTHLVFMLLMPLRSSLATTEHYEPDRSEAPKRYRDYVPTEVSPLKDSHSQLAHRPNAMNAEPRIVGGTDVGRDTYPFFVRVDTSNYPYCGGSLVAPDVVVTAAHCFTSDSELSVVVNAYDFFSSGTSLFPGQYERRIDYSIRHPAFDSSTFENDAMLLKLDNPVDVETILLNFDDDSPEVGDNLTVMGLGHTFEDGAAASILQAATVQAISNDFCRDSYKAVGLDRIKEEIMLCAGNIEDGMKDACQGDSGGPLIDGSGSLVGIVSWGVGCGRKDLPGVYCRVSGIKDWLSDNVCKMSNAPPFWCANLALINDSPTSSPTRKPATPFPTNDSTSVPTRRPSPAPLTPQPTDWPSESPTLAPVTLSPTDGPTFQPSGSPTRAPIIPPSLQPTQTPDWPSESPTLAPVTLSPTDRPTFQPSDSPTRAPIIPPSPQPTQTPTFARPTAAAADEFCKDRTDLFEAGDLRGGKTCDWLRGSHDNIRKWFCIPGSDPWNVCEDTCGKCNCVNSNSALFAVDGDAELRDCEWLDSTQSMQQKLCVAGSDAYAKCQRTCGSCPALSPYSDEEIRSAFDNRTPMRKDPFST